MNVAPANVFATWNLWKLSHPTVPDTSRADESGGRWYPTLVTLADSRVLAMSGHPSKSDPRHCNNTPEVYSHARDRWNLLQELLPGDFARLVDSLNLVQYPRLHVLPNGDVFCVTPLHSLDTRIQSSLRYNIATQTYNLVGGQIVDPDYLADAIVEGHNTTSVLLPYLLSQGYHSQVLLCGASQPLRIDLDSAAPAWHPTNPRTLAGQPARYNLNAVLLPTGDVFICGGVSDRVNKLNSSGVVTPEVYHPETDQWETLDPDPAGVVRNYHSTAVLMPDGRVWMAGSNKDGTNSVGLENGPNDTHEPRIRIYEPWYHYRTRPTITSAPRGMLYWRSSEDDHAYRVYAPNTEGISRVAIIRIGSTTHAFNSDQRYIELAFQHRGQEIDVTPPKAGGIAPPGIYLLFIVDSHGVPSVGSFIWISDRDPQPGTAHEFLAGVAADHSIYIYQYDPSTNWSAGHIPWASMQGPLTSWSVGDVWHLAGVATDQNLYVLWQSPGHDWQAANISEMTGARVAGPITSWVFKTSEFLAGVAADHSIYIYRYDPSTNWTVGHIPWASMHGPLTSWVVGDVWHLAGVATDQNLYVLWQSPGQDWHAANISEMTGVQVVGRVSSWVVGDVEHLAAIGSDGFTYVFWYSPARNWQVANISQITGVNIVSAPVSLRI
jgi:hypothetical protein